MRSPLLYSKERWKTKNQPNKKDSLSHFARLQRVGESLNNQVSPRERQETERYGLKAVTLQNSYVGILPLAVVV